LLRIHALASDEAGIDAQQTTPTLAGR
jgi:hypothetical protein